MRFHITILCGALTCSAAVHAQLPVRVGEQTVANSTFPDDQDQTAVAYDGFGNFVVAWRAAGQDGDGSAIVARRFDGSSGEPLSDEILINTSAAGDQSEPAVAVAPDGRFVVAWTGPESNGSPGIFASLRDPSGQPVVAEFQVNEPDAGEQRNASVALQPTGHFAVTWQSDAPSPLVDWEIEARIFDALAVPGKQFRVNRILLGNQERPAVAPDARDGGWFVVWHGLDLLSLFPSIFHLELLADGPPPPNVIEVLLNLLTPDLRSSARIGSNSAGDAVAVWEAPDGDGRGIFSRSLAGGVPVGQEERINVDPAGEQREPAVALDEHDRFVVTWIHEESVDSPLGSPIVVQGRKKTRTTSLAGGLAGGDVFRVDTFGDRPAAPAVATRPGGEFVVAWQVEGIDDPDDPLGRAAVFQRFADPLFLDGLESGDFQSWSYWLP